MGRIRDQLQALTVRAQSPDGCIRGHARAARLEACGFVEGAYEQYEPDALEHQLARLATRLYTGHERGRRMILEEAGYGYRRDPATANSKAEREYLEQVYSITAEGTGPRDEVWLATTGMMEWECMIREGALENLSEDDFLNEVIQAGREVLKDTRYKELALKDEYFGLGIPEFTAERKKRAAHNREFG